nr:MAG TPA: hypothetical protein [Caudoviricetes sp.]
MLTGNIPVTWQSCHKCNIIVLALFSPLRT